MYNAYITRIKNVRKHNNADRLQIGECFGNQVVVGLDTVEDQLGIYFPTDGKLGQAYAEVNNLIKKKDENGVNIGGYLDPDKRNIRTMKLRGEDSDGLFMPLESLETFTNISKLKDGDTITKIGDIIICEKYIPMIRKSGERDDQDSPKDYPIFEQHKSTQQLAFSLERFKPGDLCRITLKAHGTSGRTSRTIKIGHIESPGIKNKILRLLGKRVPKQVTKSWEYATGTRRTVLRIGDNDNYRNKWHKFFEGKLQKGETVYYEIVGYEETGKPIMPSCSNAKVQDKDFVKQYGEMTHFTYGCELGQNQIYVYRMTLTNEDGYVVEYPWSLMQTRCEQMGVNIVHELDTFTYTTEEDLMERVNRFVDGPDPIGKTHVREGIVVRIENRPEFVALKHKNFYFKVLEGIIKDDGIVDTEEEESLGKDQ